MALARAVRTQQVSASEICALALARAEADELGCLWALDSERARRDAAQVDTVVGRGGDPGPLAGVPVVVKDCFDVAGLPTTVGVRRTQPAPAATDADAVARLRRSGAIVLGKAAMDQLAWGMSGDAPGFPPCRNPAAPGRMPGGSSSGSAVAVASGLVPIALGTDAGGSVRVPAAWCGVIGAKPSFGAVPLRGCAPMARSFDTAGVLARSVRDCRTVLAVLTETRLGSREPGTRVVVGVSESAFSGAYVAVDRACREVLRVWEGAGAVLEPIELPWGHRLLGPLYAAELAADWGAEVDAARELFTDEVLLGVERGRQVAAVDYLAGRATIERFGHEAIDRASGLDVLASPTAPILAPPVSEADPTAVAGRNARPFNGLGWPALSLPCGDVDGLPVGLQVAAPPGREPLLLRVAERLERLLATSR